MNWRIFIIDDEPDLARIAADLLKKEGHLVTCFKNPVEGLAKIKESSPDLLLLDLQMPRMDGFDVCREMKLDPKTRQIPIVIVSVKLQEADVVAALELGADDYIYKPFRERELLARIKTVMRRRHSEPPEKLRAGPIVIDYSVRRAWVDEQELNLRPKEFELLAFFIRNEEKVLTRHSIAQNVWGNEHIPTSRTIDSHVKALRKQLGRCGEWIKSLYGIGYRFETDSDSHS